MRDGFGLGANPSGGTMKVSKGTIVNELGNTIDFEIRADDEEVTVFASGPASEVEHTWTRMEAFTLCTMLTQIL
jgi:hypothetical protein